MYAYIYIYIYIFSFILFPYELIVPCAIQQMLADYLFYIQSCVYFNPKVLIYSSLQIHLKAGLMSPPDSVPQKQVAAGPLGWMVSSSLAWWDGARARRPAASCATCHLLRPVRCSQPRRSQAQNCCQLGSVPEELCCPFSVSGAYFIAFKTFLTTQSCLQLRHCFLFFFVCLFVFNPKWGIRFIWVFVVSGEFEHREGPDLTTSQLWGCYSLVPHLYSAVTYLVDAGHRHVPAPQMPWIQKQTAAVGTVALVTEQRP